MNMPKEALNTNESGQKKVVDIFKRREPRPELAREQRLKLLTVVQLFIGKDKARILAEEGEKKGLYTVEIEEKGEIAVSFTCSLGQFETVEALAERLKDYLKRNESRPVKAVDISGWRESRPELTREERLEFLTAVRLFSGKDDSNEARILAEEGKRRGLYTIEIEEKGQMPVSFTCSLEQLETIKSLADRLKENVKRTGK
jgi:hypothetical protein